MIEQVGRTRQLAPVVSRRVSLGARTSRRLFAAAAASVLIAVAGVTGVRIHQLQGDEAQRDQLAAIVAASDAHSVHGAVTGGGRITLVVSRRRAEALVIVDGLPPAPKGRTYQLWLLNDGSARSAGLLDVTAPTRITRVVKSPLTHADGFGVTVEPEGGSPRPTTPVIAHLPLG